MDKGSRRSQPRSSVGLHITMIMALLVSVIIAVALTPRAAHAAPVASSAPLATQQLGVTVTTTATAADVQAVAAPGEGVIRIVTRVCGAAPSLAHWRSVAAANGITPPTYLVLLGQRLTVSCSSELGTGGAQPEISPAPSAAPSSGWANPLPGACITDTFGYHAWRGYVHQGTDIGADTGTPIRAAAGGQVTRSGWIWSGYGISVTIAHDGGWSTHYAHMSRTAVGYGVWVAAGQVIGYVGSTGQVTGPHLHFEVASSRAVLGAQIDPVPFMRARGVWLGC